MARWIFSATLGATGVLCVALLLCSVGCKWLAQRYGSAKYDQQAAEASEGYARAKSDGERASRLAQRGRAYSDKGRYSRLIQCISLSNYERLFARAMQDHDQAVALAPNQSDVYLLRGWSYYDRATVLRLDKLESTVGESGWLQLAQADFTRAIERDPRSVLAWDMRALIRGVLGDHDGVIADLTASTKLDPSGRPKLGDAYCERGNARRSDKDLAGAVADYEEAVVLGTPADGCTCEPYQPLVSAYEEMRDFDAAWRVVRRARAANRSISPEAIARLSQASGRKE